MRTSTSAISSRHDERQTQKDPTIFWRDEYNFLAFQHLWSTLPDRLCVDFIVPFASAALYTGRVGSILDAVASADLIGTSSGDVLRSMCRLKFIRYSCKCVSAVPTFDTVCEARRAQLSQNGNSVENGALCKVVNFEVQKPKECPEHWIKNMSKRAELQRMKEQMQKGTWLDGCVAEVERSREENRMKEKKAEKRDAVDKEGVAHEEFAESQTATNG